MSIQESGEMYLETIYILSEGKKPVRSIDVADYMGFSKPSVSRAVGKLREEKLILVDNDGYISFTKTGKNIAEKIYERHNVLKSFIMKLGVDEETATSDACKIEHVISNKTFDALKEFLK